MFWIAVRWDYFTNLIGEKFVVNLFLTCLTQVWIRSWIDVSPILLDSIFIFQTVYQVIDSNESGYGTVL